MLELFKIGFITVSIVDLADILIVGIIFYWLYKALRGTVAIQVLISMVLMVFLSFVTEALNLKTVSWIIKTITSIWLVAFIILFQPEIRRLLMIITRSQVFRMFIKPQISKTYDEVAEAVEEMAEKHIGALLVFPRSQNVTMTLDSGIELQSFVTKELLLSIFNTKSPLHDGAVIIENDLIITAKCILPLSTATSVDGRLLGTRHRAALGLSEQVDAIVLIVSEETGAISFATEGKIEYNIPKKEFKKLLLEKFSTK
jgi:diadenylate cyclase